MLVVSFEMVMATEGFSSAAGGAGSAGVGGGAGCAAGAEAAGADAFGLAVWSAEAGAFALAG